MNQDEALPDRTPVSTQTSAGLPTPHRFQRICLCSSAFYTVSPVTLCSINPEASCHLTATLHCSQNLSASAGVDAMLNRIPYRPGSIPCFSFAVDVGRSPTAAGCSCSCLLIRHILQAQPKTLHSVYTQNPLGSYICFNNLKCSVHTL